MKKFVVPFLLCMTALLFFVAASFYEYIFGEHVKDIVEKRLCFMQGRDDTFVVHPFWNDVLGYVVVLPAGWNLDSVYVSTTKDIEDVEENEFAEETGDSEPFVCNKVDVQIGQKQLVNIKNLSIGGNYEMVTFYQAKMHSIFINAKNSKMERVNASIDHSEKAKGKIKILSKEGNILYNGKLKGIKGRGNSSWLDPMKPYSIELAQRTEIFGLNKAKKYNLLSNNDDESSVRNAIVYTAAQKVDLPYPIKFNFVGLYVNGEYLGLYQITNKVAIDSAGVNITNLRKLTQQQNERNLKKFESFVEENGKKGILGAKNPEDISGGYLLEVVNNTRNKSGFTASDNKKMSIKSPEYATREQVEYISNFYQEVIDAVYSENGINPNTQKHYTDYMDITSFVKYYMLTEYFLNIDGATCSSFFYKDRDSIDSKLYAAPIWDFDHSIGNFKGGQYGPTIKAFYISEKENMRNGGLSMIAQVSHKSEAAEIMKVVYSEKLLPYIEYLLSGGLDSLQNTLKNDLYYSNLKNRPESGYEYIAQEFDEIKTFLQVRLSMFQDVWIDQKLDLKPVFARNNRLYKFYLRENEKIQLPQNSVLNNGKAAGNWILKRTGKMYSETDSLVANDTLELQWHKPGIKDYLGKFREKFNREYLRNKNGIKHFFL